MLYFEPFEIQLHLNPTGSLLGLSESIVSFVLDRDGEVGGSALDFSTPLESADPNRCHHDRDTDHQCDDCYEGI